MRCIPRAPVAPSDPSLRLSRGSVAHCFASLGSIGVCRWRRRSLRFACHMTASLIASLLMRCKRCVPVAPSVPSLRSSHDGVARYFASLALQTACACGVVGTLASLVTRRRRSLLGFSCVANGVCLGRRRSLRFARHMVESLIASLFCVATGVCPWRRQSPRFARRMTALLIASLLLRCKRRVPVAPSSFCFARHMTTLLIASLLLRCKRRVPVVSSVPSLRSSQNGVAHCFAPLA